MREDAVQEKLKKKRSGKRGWGLLKVANCENPELKTGDV